METYSSCCVQGLAGFWSSYRPLTDPEDSVLEVVYNWLQGGLQPGRRLLLLRLRPGLRVRRGQGAVHRNYHYHHNNNYHPWAAAVLPGGRDKFHCSLESVRVPTLLCKPKCQSIMF